MNPNDLNEGPIETMRLEGVELVRVDVLFRNEIGTAAGVHRTRALLFVRVVAGGGEGWGECAALAEGTAVDPPLHEVEQAADDHGVGRLLRAAAARNGRLPSAAEVPQLFGSGPADRLLAAAFEMAVSDVELRARGRSLAEDLGVGAGFESLPVGAVLGIPPDRDLGLLRHQVDVAISAGAARARVKIEPGWDVEPIRAIRAEHPALTLQVDANGSYRAEPDDIARLARLAEFGVLCVEQPLPPSDLVALAQLAQKLPIPICLDESLSSPRPVSPTTS